MALSSSNTEDLYKGLKYNFLFNNDINCIHILLNLYDLENNITNIFPRYVSISHIKKRIIRLLNQKNGNHLIAYNLGELLHEDVNRLELFIYIEGYKHGYLDTKEINNLEQIAVEYYTIPELYNLKYLFHIDSDVDEIAEYKNKVMRDLSNNESINKDLYQTILDYCIKIIRPKVLRLNDHIDKQMIMSLDLKNSNFKEDTEMLTLVELVSIYEEVERILFIKVEELYKEAYWNGLNDRLLRRYK